MTRIGHGRRTTERVRKFPQELVGATRSGFKSPLPHHIDTKAVTAVSSSLPFG